MGDALVQSVRKAFDALDILVFEDFEKKGIGLYEFAKKMELKPSTLHNILKTMVSCGYVSQIEGSKYIAGPKCDNIGLLNKLMSESTIAEKIEPILCEAGKKIGETIVFTILSNGNRIPLFHIDHENIIKIDMSSIENEHIYEKPTGRIMTAYADEYNFKLIKERWGYPGDKWNGINDDVSFKKTITDLREIGYSMAKGGKNSAVCYAVPVIDSKMKLIGSIGYYAPVFRCDNGKQKLYLEQLLAAADNIRKLFE